jgi:uncharacterized membrane protein
MEHLSFWTVVLVIPLLVVVGNVVARWLRGMPHSAASDLILAFVVFDAAVAINAPEFFQPLVKHPPLRGHLVAVYVTFIIANLILWAVAVFKIEYDLVMMHNKRLKRYTSSPAKLLLMANLISIFVFASNTFIFAYGG